MCLEFLKNPFHIITCGRPEHLTGGGRDTQLFCKLKYLDNKFFLLLLLPTVGDIVFIAQFVDNPSSYTFFWHNHYKYLLPFGPGTA